jgi:rhamnose transport system ATP-binding protein
MEQEGVVPLLQFRGVSKRFFGVHALEDVSFTVARGEVHALCGANGAGKSTLMKILVGVHQPDHGQILLDGSPVTLSGPAAARTLGIDIVFQEIELPSNLTVAEAVFLGREPRRFGFVDYGRMFSDTAAVLERLGVPIDPSALVEELSVAEKQLVQITRALSGETRVLIMDEPTSALTDHETERLFRLLDALRERGTTILYVSHKLEEIFRLSQQVTVLRDGRVAGARPTAELTPDELVRMMVGANTDDEALDPRAEGHPHAATAAGEVVLEARGLTRPGAFEEVSFALRKGEVLGMFGIVGAGRTEVARCLFGLDPYTSGTVLLAGQPVNFHSAADAVRAGLALVPEDRKLQGLVLEMSLQRNVSLASLPRLAPVGVVNSAGETRMAAEAVRDLGVVTDGLEQEVKQLSGGNQQKVVIGKWLATGPRVLILDEPTKGIDVAAKREVHELVRRLARRDLAVLLISSELNEVLALSDRLLVLHEGRVTAELDPATTTREEVLRFAVS